MIHVKTNTADDMCDRAQVQSAEVGRTTDFPTAEMRRPQRLRVVTTLVTTASAIEQPTSVIQAKMTTEQKSNMVDIQLL